MDNGSMIHELVLGSLYLHEFSDHSRRTRQSCMAYSRRLLSVKPTSLWNRGNDARHATAEGEGNDRHFYVTMVEFKYKDGMDTCGSLTTLCLCGSR